MAFSEKFSKKGVKPKMHKYAKGGKIYDDPAYEDVIDKTMLQKQMMDSREQAAGKRFDDDGYRIPGNTKANNDDPDRENRLWKKFHNGNWTPNK